MGTAQPTATCPACGTRALVDPRTGKVRSHLRKGGVPCEGRKAERRGLLRRRAAAEAEVEEQPRGLVRVRAICPVCVRLCSVGEDDFRIRRHRDRQNRTCRGSGTVPDMDTVKLDGMTVAEAKRRRRAALAEEKAEAPRAGLRGRLGGIFSRSGSSA